MDRDYSNILIGCPQHQSKSYAFARWIDSVNQFPCDKLVVDNSETLEFYNRWQNQVRMTHIDLGSEPPNRRIAISMECIRKYFLAGNWKWYWNVESDILVPPYLLDFLVPHMGSDIVTIPYPSRTTGEMLEHSFGCALFSRRVLERESFLPVRGDDENATSDAWWYQRVSRKYNLKVIHSAVALEHLAEREVCLT